jgi:hypothetical protein
MTFQSSGRIYRSAIPFGLEMTRRDLFAFERAMQISLIHYFVFFALQCLKIFAACANFPVARGYPKRGFARAKNAKSGSLIFFAAFAPLREIFRVLDAAQPR